MCEHALALSRDVTRLYLYISQLSNVLESLASVSGPSIYTVAFTLDFSID